VGSRGLSKGPDGVTIKLKAEDGTEVAQSQTTSGGSFVLPPVLPGTYQLSASHSSYRFVKDSAKITVAPSNFHLAPNTLVVAGYDVKGLVFSNGEPVKGVSVLLFPSKVSAHFFLQHCHWPVLHGTISGLIHGKYVLVSLEQVFARITICHRVDFSCRKISFDFIKL